MSLIPSFADLICFLNSYQWAEVDAVYWIRGVMILFLLVLIIIIIF